ncbi:MAG: radical SAM protein [Planctomycetes bacterium SM23_32]|nr:MAG: radical SAM protein [Planctomycetes bacterium SM23_32]
MEAAHEAILYARAEEQAVNCFLCSHRCRIAEGRRGFCRVRENRRGTLYSLVYGRPVARHMDPIEKKPLYHFLPGTPSYSIATPGCNFRCPFCQNWQISQADAAPAFEALGYVAPEQVVEEAVAGRAASIAYTYTEPTIFMEFALDCARLASRQGLRNVFVTNGYQTPEAVEAMAGLIDAANVDLKAFSEEFYRTQCQGHLQPVLDTIGNMHAAGIHVEVTTLVVPGGNDTEAELRGIAEFIAGTSPDMPWHISRFHPNYLVTDRPATPMASLELAERLGREAGLNYVYLGNVLTEQGQNTRCPGCGRVLLRRSGFARPDVKIEEPRCPNCGRDVPIVLK